MNYDDPEPKTRWRMMIGGSLGIHIIIIGGAVMLASGSAPRRSLYAPSISVGLYGPSKLGPSGGAGDPAGQAPAAESEPAPSPVDEKASPLKPEKTEPAPPKMTPAAAQPKKALPPKEAVRVPKKTPPRKKTVKKRDAPPRKETPPKKVVKPRQRPKPKSASRPSEKSKRKRSLNTKELDQLAKIRKRLSARASRPDTGGSGRDRGSSRGPGGTEGTRGESRGLPGGRNAYKNELAQIFYGAWVLPNPLRNMGLKVILVLQINRGGQILKTDILESSGNRLFDESVMRAVSKVKIGGGVPPLPPEFSEGVLEQGLIFDPKHLRQ